ncbi:MAG: recombinase family protein [Synergistaceae bacterium]|nr:recombinase family protein [Synergistaceae bacterium]
MTPQIEYGYARKSSRDKEATIQLTALKEAGIPPGNIFVDRPAEREKFKQLADRIQPGDVLVLKSLCQLGYNYQEILNEWTTFTGPLGAHIKVLDADLLDTSVEREDISGSFVSDIFVQIISFAAQQERALIKRRQAEGIAYAKAQGRHMGRPRIPKPPKFNELYDRWRTGIISAEEAMSQMNLKRSTFERFVKERKEELKRAAEEREKAL